MPIFYNTCIILYTIHPRFINYTWFLYVSLTIFTISIIAYILDQRTYAGMAREPFWKLRVSLHQRLQTHAESVCHRHVQSSATTRLGYRMRCTVYPVNNIIKHIPMFTPYAPCSIPHILHHISSTVGCGPYASHSIPSP